MEKIKWPFLGVLGGKAMTTQSDVKWKLMTDLEVRADYTKADAKYVRIEAIIASCGKLNKNSKNISRPLPEKRW